MALSSQRLHVNSSGIVENVLYSLADQNPQQYADSFQRLAAWVDDSLDLYKVRYCRLRERASMLHDTSTFIYREVFGCKLTSI